MTDSKLRGMFLFGRTSTQQRSKPPQFLRLRSSTTFIISVGCIAVFTDFFLYAIVIPVIPFALRERVGLPEHEVQHWTSILLSVYGATLLVSCPICGWIADRTTTRRQPILAGAIVLAGAVTLLCIGNSKTILVIGRMLAGLSTAIMWTVGPPLLVDTVGKKDVGKAMGYVLLGVNVAVLIGPLIGGVVYAHAGYYAVFAISFGLVFIDFLLRLALIEKRVAAKYTNPRDQTASLYWACAYSPQGSPTIISASPISETGSFSESVLSKSFNWDESSTTAIITPSQQPKASLPPVFILLKSARLLSALWGSFSQALIITSADAVVPLFVHRTFGWSPTGAGLIFLAIVIPTLVAPAVGYLTDKFGPRWPTTLGFIFCCAVLVLLRLVTHHSLRQIVLCCALFALLGFFMTFVQMPLMAEITFIVEAKEEKDPGLFGQNGAYAQAYGLYFCAFAAGVLVGPLWGGYIVQSAGWGTMTWSLGLLSGVSAIPAVIWTGGLITKRHEVRWEDRGEVRRPKAGLDLV